MHILEAINPFKDTDEVFIICNLLPMTDSNTISPINKIKLIGEKTKCKIHCGGEYQISYLVNGVYKMTPSLNFIECFETSINIPSPIIEFTPTEEYPAQYTLTVLYTEQDLLNLAFKCRHIYNNYDKMKYYYEMAINIFYNMMAIVQIGMYYLEIEHNNEKYKYYVDLFIDTMSRARFNPSLNIIIPHEIHYKHFINPPEKI